MPTDLQIIRSAEFIRRGTGGHWDFEASKQALAELAYACHKRGIRRALMDLRAIKVKSTPYLSPANVAALVHTFGMMGFGKSDRLAVVYITDPHRNLELFTFLSKMRGWHVAAFDDFGEAIVWLSGGEPGEIDVEPLPPPVPIKVKERPARAGTKGQSGSRPIKRHLISRH